MLTPFGRVVVSLLVLAIAGTAFLVLRPGGSGGSGPQTRSFASDDPVERGCDLPPVQLLRLWRGHDPVRSEDVTTVPQPPNYSGSFGTTSHSGPWDYVQTVPLVLYGPGNIAPRGRLDQAAGITDVYPTVGALTGVDLPKRAGKVLTGALEKGASPKLILTVMWDGVGRNVLEHWPDRWPNLAAMEREGTSYLKATVGSSPSITPATHANLGTGTWPRRHGVTAIEMRDGKGQVKGAFSGRDPKILRSTTFGDDVDRALGNAPKVGMIAWKSWHLGMLGHGSQLPGGDQDDLGLIGKSITGNPSYYRTPGYLTHLPGLDEEVEDLDQADGKADGLWRGHSILEQHDNPAWISYETDALIALMRRESYGGDDVPDLLMTNYKITDIVAHRYNMDMPEMGDVLEAQDAALGRLRDYLDDNVGDYVLIVSADHGNTPPASRSGAWPLQQGELQRDLDEHFEVPEGTSLVLQGSAAGPFLDRGLMKKLDIDAADVAAFFNGYTIRDNWREPDLPDGYEGRGGEQILSAAFPSRSIGRVMKCATGSRKPPPGLQG